MRLSLVFELLLIFVLLAFAASAAVVPTDSRGARNKGIKSVKSTRRKTGNKNRQQDANKYCSCSTKLCNCCREFNIPVVALQGPGCASLQYLKGDRLAISMSFGERILTNTTISSRKPKPVCMPLPGGVSKFCGRVYNIGRKGTDFNACLGLELRSLNEIEAAVRVSCFRFGPQGLRVEPPKPLPAVEDDDEDDDDEEEDEYDEDDDDNDVDSEDYGTFSVFGDDIIDGLFAAEADADTSDEKPAKKPTSAKPPTRKVTRKSVRSTTIAPKTQKPTRRKATTTTTTTTKPTTVKTSTTPQTESTSTIFNQSIIEEPIPSSAPHESIAAVTAMLQASPEIPAPIEVAVPSTPANSNITDFIKNITEIKENETPTTTAISNEKEEEEEKPTTSFIIKNDEDEEDDDEDPIADAIEEELEDDSEEGTNDKDQNKVNEGADGNKKKGESEDVVDEIIDGVVDTFGEEESEKKNGTQVSNEDDDDDDDDDDEDDDSEESRKQARTHLHRRFSNKRQSRDMWLDRLHW